MNSADRSKPAYLIEIATPFVAVIAGLAFCYFAAPVIVPVIVGISLAYVFYPVVKYLKRHRIPNLPAVLIVAFCAIILFAGISVLIYYQGVRFLQAFPEIKSGAEQFLITQLTNLREPINKFFPNLIPAGQEEQIVKDALRDFDYEKIGKAIFRGLGSVFPILGNLILIAIISFFILLEADGFKKNLTLVFGEDNKETARQILSEINRQISAYFALKFTITIALAVIYTLGLLLMGIDYAYIWGPLAGLVSLVPFIGAYAGAVPPMLMAAIQHNSIWWVIWVFMFFMVVQFFESYLVSPKLFGERANLNLTTVMVSTILWGWMWGAIGVLLAVPLTAALKVICSNLKPLNPVARILEGRMRF